MCTQFKFKRTILILWSKFAQKRYSRNNEEKGGTVTKLMIAKTVIKQKNKLLKFNNYNIWQPYFVSMVLALHS